MVTPLLGGLSPAAAQPSDAKQPPARPQQRLHHRAGREETSLVCHEGAGAGGRAVERAGRPAGCAPLRLGWAAVCHPAGL